MRYTLKDRKILIWAMKNPGRGAPFSVRELAETAGLTHHSLVGHLRTGERTDCDEDVARRIAEAVGMSLLNLFAPSLSMERITPSTARETPTSRSPHAIDT